MIRQILIGVVGAVVAGLIAAAAEGAFGALSALLGPSIPPGAVVAFDKECPDGWDPFHAGAGRFLIGTGKVGETTIKLGKPGGSHEHTLTVPEMPEHTHDDIEGRLLLVQKSSDTTATEVDRTGHNEINIRHGVRMKVSGEGKPHPIMPPYVPVSFCEKT